jgi:hypothetical protein
LQGSDEDFVKGGGTVFSPVDQRTPKEAFMVSSQFHS